MFRSRRPTDSPSKHKSQVGQVGKMSEYFFGRLADLVAPITKNEEKNIGEITQEKRVRVKKLKFSEYYHNHDKFMNLIEVSDIDHILS